MKGSIPVILVFDIGKTNKKWLVFDQEYKAIAITFFDVEQTVDKDGYPSENIDLLMALIRNIATAAINNSNWDLKAINFTAYGATLVNTNNGHTIVHEVTNYLKPYPPAVLGKFNTLYNDSEAQLCAETASPLLENLNTALQLYALKQTDPVAFESMQYATYLPQYLSSLFTGTYCAELTSIGCHTLSWNLVKKQYHNWIIQEGIDQKFPPIQSAKQTTSVAIEHMKVWVGIGLHDSSSALLPYLMTIKHPFMLLSTGSWSICLNPFNHNPLTKNELAQDCLCYLRTDGEPVKASRLNAGFMHEDMLTALCIHFNNKKEDYLILPFDQDLFVRVEAKRTQHNPGHVFEPRDWSNYKEAYMAAVLTIVDLQVAKIKLVSSSSIEALYVDGGFSKNPLFMQAIKVRLPQYRIYAAEVGQSTALGAALVVHSFWNNKTIPQNLISLRAY